MEVFYDHYPTMSWDLRPSLLQGGLLHIPQGHVSTLETCYTLPEVTFDLSQLNSITIVEQKGVAYYVLWQPGCVMSGDYNHILEFMWKEGETWRYVKNASEGTDH